MEKELLRKKLDENLEDMPWTYTILVGEGVVKLNNIEAESLGEEEFLENLKEEGSECVIDGRGSLTYKIMRLDGKLHLSLFRDESNVVGDRKEIKEREALRIFRETKQSRESGGLENLLGLFRGGRRPPKELVPNDISLKFDRIKNIALEEDEKFDTLEMDGEGFKVELREDGGCSVLFL